MTLVFHCQECDAPTPCILVVNDDNSDAGPIRCPFDDAGDITAGWRKMKAKKVRA